MLPTHHVQTHCRTVEWEVILFRKFSFDFETTVLTVPIVSRSWQHTESTNPPIRFAGLGGGLGGYGIGDGGSDLESSSAAVEGR